MKKYKNRKELEKHQEEELLKLVRKVYDNVPYYKEKMDKQGVKVEDIKTLEDLRKLPFTTKDDLRDNYPFNTFGKELKDIVRVHASSGTTGKPTVVGYTKEDICNWSNINKRNLENIGVTNEDIFQVSYGYGLFTGGLGMHYGAENLGATVIPISTGNTKKQVMLMQDFNTSVIACTPSYMLHLYDYLKANNIDRNTLKLEKAVLGAEPWSEEMRKDIEEKMQIKAYDIYGLSEIMGPGVGMECLEQNGLHVNEDFFIVEIIDSETGEVKPLGETGELVITTLKKDGIPLIRYRTKDITHIIPELCACGNIFRRIHRLQGRVDDMLIIKGVNVFPSQIESVLIEIEHVLPHYQIYVDRINNMDRFEIKIEVDARMEEEKLKVYREIKENLNSVLGIHPIITLVDENTLPRFEGKAIRVIDSRKLK